MGKVFFKLLIGNECRLFDNNAQSILAHRRPARNSWDLWYNLIRAGPVSYTHLDPYIARKIIYDIARAHVGYLHLVLGRNAITVNIVGQHIRCV